MRRQRTVAMDAFIQIDRLPSGTAGSCFRTNVPLLVRPRAAGLDLRLPLQDARDHRDPEVGVVLGYRSKGRAVLQLARDRAALSCRPSLQELQQLPLVHAELYRTVPKSTSTPPPSRRMRSDEWLAEIGR